MQAMAWWLVPLAVFVIALVWVSVANRPRPPADPHDSMAEHERFRQAMSRSIAAPTPGRPLRPADGLPADPSAGESPAGHPGPA